MTYQEKNVNPINRYAELFRYLYHEKLITEYTMFYPDKTVSFTYEGDFEKIHKMALKKFQINLIK